MTVINRLIEETINESLKIVEWPKTYINRDTLKTYRPHNAEEEAWVFNDTPSYLYVSGGEGCVGPDTLINNEVPIGDWTGGKIKTLFGLGEGSRSYLKGVADLYRVVVNRHQIDVTLDHKFLSEQGWFPLKHLTVGQKIYLEKEFGVISNISFVKTGEYYDLSVPIFDHYIANGFANHNSGKTVALVIKTLERLRRGMSGMMVSPNLPHFRRSLFPEFMRWIPRSVVIEEHQRYFHPAWEPYRSFDLVVHNEVGGFSKLTCVGGDNPIMLEGPNLSFGAMDEIRGMPTDEILKVLTGRIRVPGPKGEPPQLFCSSTPKMHWMFDYFGPMREDDPYEEFKQNSYVIRLSTKANIEAGNVDASYILRGASLTEAQKRVRLEGEWGEEDNPEAFLEDMVQWDSLHMPTLPPLRLKTDPSANYSDRVVLGVDGAVTRDYFAIVAVTRSPFNKEDIAVRHVKVWIPGRGKIDFDEVEKWIKNFCNRYNVATLVYDVYQLHDMMQRLTRDRVVWCQEFGQTKSRSLADQGLYDMILRRELIHNGDSVLREHINNADTKLDPELHKRRLVKRAQALKIDAAVALSMASFEAKRLNLA